MVNDRSSSRSGAGPLLFSLETYAIKLGLRFSGKRYFCFFSWCDFSLQSDHSRSIRCASYIIPNYYDFNELT